MHNLNVCPGGDNSWISLLVQTNFQADQSGSWDFRINAQFGVGLQVKMNGAQVYLGGAIRRIGDWKDVQAQFSYWMAAGTWNSITFAGMTGGWAGEAFHVEFKRPNSDNWEVFSTAALKMKTAPVYSCDEPTGQREPRTFFK